jgi:6-phosphofructokinase 2
LERIPDVPDIVTLTINPAIDIFINVDRVEPTGKLRCSAPKRDPGGGGINVARVAHRLGCSVVPIYPTGGAIGKLLHRLVEREGIDSLVTPSHVETRENFTAYEESTGEQYRFVLPGSALHRAEWEAVLDKLTTLPDKPKFVVASGSVLRECRKTSSRASRDAPSSSAPNASLTPLGRRCGRRLGRGLR